MLLHYLFIVGICVEAITGALAAGRKKMDFLGCYLLRQSLHWEEGP